MRMDDAVPNQNICFKISIPIYFLIGYCIIHPTSFTRHLEGFCLDRNYKFKCFYTLHFQLGRMAHCAYSNKGVRCCVWTCSLYIFVSIFPVLKIIFYFLLSISVWILIEYGNTISGISEENWENNFTGILYMKSLLIYSTIWNICYKFTSSIMKWESICTCTYMYLLMYDSTIAKQTRQ